MGKHRWPTAGDEEAPSLNLPVSLQVGARRDVDGDDQHPTRAVEELPRAVGGPRSRSGGQEALPGAGIRWRVARSAALVFLGIALAIGTALFLVRSSEPSAAAVSVQLDAETPDAPDAGGGGSNDGGSGSTGSGSTGSGSTGSGGTATRGGGGGGSGDDRTAPSEQDQDQGQDQAGAVGSSAGTPASGTGGAAQGGIIVYVTGAVASPGVVTVPVGTRVFEVLEKAGGALPEADLEGINLASTPVDGQHIHLLAVGEEPRTDNGIPGAPAPPSGGPAGTSSGTPGGSGGSAEPGAIDINTATLAEIESLPRVGPILGQRIIDWRDEHGPFVQASDIDAVPGIGPAMLEGILPLIVVQ